MQHVKYVTGKDDLT